MYRTGDMASWRDDGTLEFIGRVDEQVKVHGVRIELGEIEASLRSLPEIADAVVVMREASKSIKKIVAYVVRGTETVPDAAEIRRSLSERLPAYMLPAVFMPIEKLPRSPNGKVDRRSLPDPTRQKRSLREPQTPEECALGKMFAEVLRLEDVGVEDDFFELGGDSLSAMRLAGRISANFSIALSLRDFYSASRVGDLATLVQAMQFITASNTNQARQDAEVLEEEEI